MPVSPACGLAFYCLGLLPIALPIVDRADAVDRRWPGDACRLGRVKHHDRLFAFARLLDRLTQKLAICADRLIGRTEMLVGAILYCAHRLAGPLVVHIDVGAHAGIGVVLLLMGIKTVVVALVLVRDVIRQLIELEPLP